MRPEVTSCCSPLTRRRMLTVTAGLFGSLIAPSVALSQAVPSSKMTADSAHQAALAGDIILVDIRTPEEWADTGIGDGAIALDMREDSFVGSLVDLRKANPDIPIAIICRTGNRSGYVIGALAKQGFPGLVDVREGMAGGRNGKGWIPRGLPTYPGTQVNIAARLETILGCADTC